MQRFKFRLEAVLKVRSAAEEEAKRLYREAQRATIEMMDQIQGLDRKRTGAIHSGIETLQDRKALDSFVQALDAQENDLNIALKILRDEEETARLAWVEAKKELQSLENLKQKRKLEHDAEALRQEQLALDEWATLRRKPA